MSEVIRPFSNEEHNRGQEIDTELAEIQERRAAIVAARNLDKAATGYDGDVINRLAAQEAALIKEKEDLSRGSMYQGE